MRLISQAITCVAALLVAQGVLAQNWTWADCERLDDCLNDSQREMYQRALFAMEDENWFEAADLLAVLQERVGLQSELANAYAVALYQSGDLATAGIVLESYLEMHPQAGPLFQNLTRLYEAFARDEPARLVLTPADNMRLDGNTQGDNPDLLIANQEAFLEAWSSGDIQAYLDFYVPGQSPDAALDYDSWRIQREQRVYPERGISVSAENISVTYDHESRARVRFNQIYRSADYADNTRKEFVWVLQGDDWLIESEREL